MSSAAGVRDIDSEEGTASSALVEEVRWRYAADTSPFTPLEDRLLGRLGIAPTGRRGALSLMMLGAGIRLGLALVATAASSGWADVPWGRWALILGFFSLIDGVRPYTTAPAPNVAPPQTGAKPPADSGSNAGTVGRHTRSPEAGPRWHSRKVVEAWTPLLPAIANDADLRDLEEFTHRWFRTRWSAAAGAVVGGTMLAGAWLIAPEAMGDLPAGSVVLLALLLVEFGATIIFWGNFLNWAFLARESRYEHQLLWSSPADSPEVQQALRGTAGRVSLTGMWVTIYLALAMTLVGWTSSLALPLAGGFLLVGYVSTLGLGFGNRSSIQTIVRRAKDHQLADLQAAIATFEARKTELDAPQYEHLAGLFSLHDRIRDAASAPATGRTLLRTAGGLIIPTATALIAIFADVYAERVLDTLLP